MRKTIRILLILFIISQLFVSCVTKDKVESLARTVQIRRDTYGIPHIKAGNEIALYFGMGFAQAEDKLELLAKNYLISQGRGAEFFGEDYLESDLLLARFRLNEIVEREFAQVDTEIKQLFEAYTQGINYYIDSNRDSLPEWIPHFSPIDSFRHTIKIFFQFIFWGQSYEVQSQLEQLGSNMWAIAPKRTADGYTLFLANPHLPWHDEFVWYEAHLTVPGDLNISGATLLGVPFIAIGHNDFMAWSLTVNNPDMVDVYELKLNDDKSSYYYDDKVVPIEKKEAVIKIKEDDGIKEQREEFLYSEHGPIMKMKEDKAYAVKVAGLGKLRNLKVWRNLSKVKTFLEFKTTLEEDLLPFFNIAYGDREGNIFYASIGTIPVRKEGHEWNGIVDGSTFETEWSGYYSLKDMPQVENPKSGYVQNSNENPGYTCLSDTFNIDDFPFMFRDSQSIWLRTQLGLIMLEEEEKFTLERLISCKWDPRLLSAERWKDELIQLCRSYSAEDKDKKILQEAIKVLEEWDNTTSIDNKGAQLFLTWLQYIYQTRNPWKKNWNDQEPIATPRGLANEKVAVEKLIEAARKMEEIYGTLSPVWSDICYMKRGDKSFPFAGELGELGSFRVTFWSSAENGKYQAFGGDSYVLVVEFSEPLKAFSITPYGASDDPESPHFADQTELFSKDQMKPAWFREEDIKANLEKEYRPADSKRKK